MDLKALWEDLESLGFTSSLSKSEMAKEVGRSEMAKDVGR